MVVIHHSLLVVPELAAGGPGDGSFVAEVLKYSPVHFVWLGTEAVWLFFILSGFVLALPYLRSRRLDVASYYPRRLIRIYLPALAALAIALLIATIVQRPDADMSFWMQRHHSQPFSETLIDAALVFGGSTLNTPLWSLQWEVLYSLVLPLALILFARPNRWWPAQAAGMLALIVAGALTDIKALFLMPMFVLGCIIATNWPAIDHILQRVLTGRRGNLWGWLSLAAAVILLPLKWALLPLGLPGVISSAAQGTAIAGILIILLLAIAWPPVRNFLSLAPVRWLGAISFSLYLIHEPIVVTVGVLVGPDYAWLALPIALPLALLAGWLFYRLIERPSHQLARRAGRAIARRPQSAPRAAAAMPET